MTIERQQEIERLIQLLKSGDSYQRANAAKRLGQLCAAPEALLGALEDDNAHVRSEVAKALGYAATKSHTDVLDALMSAIDDRNAYVAGEAIRSLGRLQAHQARDQIVSCLDANSQIIISGSVMALGMLGATDLAERLATFLDSENFHVRFAATRAMGLLGYTPAGPKLLISLEDSLQQRKERPNSKFPAVIIEALTKLQVKEAIPRLIDIAQHEVGLRSIAIQSLVALDAEEAIPQLAHMLADPGGTLRETLVRTMIDADYRKALPVIRQLLEDTRAPVRQVALAAVTAWNDRASIKQVRTICYHDSSSHLRPRAVNTLVALAGVQALPDLIKLADDLNRIVRRAVARGFGQVGPLPPHAIQVLQRLAADAEECVVEKARESLATHNITPTPLPHQSNLPILPIPEVIQPSLPWILEELEAWQVGLANLLSRSDPDALVTVDNALTTLILILRDAEGQDGGAQRVVEG